MNLFGMCEGLQDKQIKGYYRCQVFCGFSGDVIVL